MFTSKNGFVFLSLIFLKQFLCFTIIFMFSFNNRKVSLF